MLQTFAMTAPFGKAHFPKANPFHACFQGCFFSFPCPNQLWMEGQEITVLFPELLNDLQQFV